MSDSSFCSWFNEDKKRRMLLTQPLIILLSYYYTHAITKTDSHTSRLDCGRHTVRSGHDVSTEFRFPNIKRGMCIDYDKRRIRTTRRQFNKPAYGRHRRIRIAEFQIIYCQLITQFESFKIEDLCADGVPTRRHCSCLVSQGWNHNSRLTVIDWRGEGRFYHCFNYFINI